MFHSRTVEIGVGLFVALGLAALFMLAMKVSNLAAFSGGDGYEVTARFQNVGGLKVRAPVTMSGVRVGRVKAIDFDDQSYQAVVTLDIDSRWTRIPADSTASIFTAGLLGEQYVSMEAGGDEQYLGQGADLKLTQSALVLEQIIGQFLFSKAAEGPRADTGGSSSGGGGASGGSADWGGAAPAAR
jgi:phospholipid/cholesterol/gamma-HCH transport system substrate-binding protein